MKLMLRDSLMFVPVTLSHGGATLQIDDILVAPVRPPRCCRSIA